MISTGKKGRAVAVIVGGGQDGKAIRIAPEGEAEQNRPPPFDVMDDARDWTMSLSKFRQLSIQDQRAVAAALLDNTPGPEDLRKEVAGMRPRYEELSKYEFRVTDPTATLIALPQEEPERCVISGRSGSGKSTIAALYMREYLEMFPDRRVVLITTHDGEPAYAPIEHAQILLDEDFVKAPPTLDDLANCLVVFDDCDNPASKKLFTAYKTLNDSLTANGRKYGIHVVSLIHMITGGYATRLLLSEATRVWFFNGSSSYHVHRWLKEYAGMDPKQIRRVLSSSSRWTCVSLTQPPYVLTEHEVYLLR